MDNAYGDLQMLMLWADTVYYFPTYGSTVRRHSERPFTLLSYLMEAFIA